VPVRPRPIPATESPARPLLVLAQQYDRDRTPRIDSEPKPPDHQAHPISPVPTVTLSRAQRPEGGGGLGWQAREL
jgi:hypothetical protein